MTRSAANKMAATASSWPEFREFAVGIFHHKIPVFVFCWLLFAVAVKSRAEAIQAAGTNVNDAPAVRRIFVGQILDVQENEFPAEVEGRVTQVEPGDDGTQLQLSVGNVRMKVVVTGRIADAPPALMNRLVDATGICRGAFNADGLKVPNVLQVSQWRQIKILDPWPATETNGSASAVLTTAEEVHRLSRAEAERSLPAKIRGVVTGVESRFHGIVVQDATRGLYVFTTNYPHLSDFIEAEGVTAPGYFAPSIEAKKIMRLGPGQLPEPIRPAWDQLLNGSLDAQYVRLQGVVIAANDRDASLLTSDGVIKIIVTRDGVVTGELAGRVNSMISLEGVLFAQWDQETHQVMVGEIRLCDPVLTVEQPAMADVFSVPHRTPSELLLFDPQASLFQRVCASGQVVHLGDTENFLMAGTNGLRFVATELNGIRVGDLVDVSGFPELGGASPVLRDAAVRKTGRAPLPQARFMAATNLNSADMDSTLVRLDGVLVEVRGATNEIIFDLQSEGGNFEARLSDEAKMLRTLPPGCRLELTGVYAAWNGRQPADAGGAAFELLLNSPADVKVLARPPWWTPQRLAMMVGALLFVLLAALLWISQLHRQVEQRTAQVAEQIRKRQLIEQHRAMEQERARIAQDLHDELGSALTEVSLLASIPVTAQDAQGQINQVGARARQMVGSLDEIVWAMNPKHDSLLSLGRYFCLYADRFLKPANITLRLKEPVELPDQPLNPIHRHELFLAFKEALNNVVRHSGANEVWLGLRIIDGKLRLSLTDNGVGLKDAPPGDEADGLKNMRLRLEKIGGRFSLVSQRGRGTALRFYAPLGTSEELP